MALDVTRNSVSDMILDRCSRIVPSGHPKGLKDDTNPLCDDGRCHGRYVKHNWGIAYRVINANSSRVQGSPPALSRGRWSHNIRHR